MKISFRIAITTLVLASMHKVMAQDQILRNTPLEYGVIRGNQRIGIWRYYDFPGKLGLEIDYGTMQLLYIRPDTSMFTILEGNRIVKTQLKSPCRFHGSELQLAEHYHSRISIPFELRARSKRKNENLETLLTFTVGPNGLAASPEVIGYTGFSMAKMMRVAFESAPNIWIPGIKLDDQPATCLFGVSVRICSDSCTQTRDSVRIIYDVRTSKSGVESLAPWTNELTGIQFSPNDDWILVEANLVSNTGGSGLLVLSTKKNEFRHIQYGTIKNGYWLDKEHISFNYQFSIADALHGLYNINSGEVVTRSDSITYFDRLSPDGSTLCVANRRDKRNWLLSIDVATGNRQPLQIESLTNPFPVSWSPDQKSIVIKGKKGNIDMLVLYDFPTQTYRPLPILDGEPCGWTSDGSTVFVRRTNFPFAHFSGEIFSINTKTLTFQELTGRKEGLLTAEFSPEANKFWVLLNGHLHLQYPSLDFKPVKIIDNVSAAKWSRDGTQIAYIASKGTLVCLYNIKSGRSRILRNQSFATR